LYRNARLLSSRPFRPSAQENRMRPRIRLMHTLLFAGLLAACSDATGVPDPRPVDLAFRIERLQTEPEFVVSDGNGEVKIRGYFHVGCSGYQGSAAADVSLNVLTVRLTGTQNGICFAVLENIGYQATVRGLTPGTYRLLVVHEIAGNTGSDHVVLESSVHVQ
jgi:hypothetical protein